jgi:hypothetical protein
MPEDVAGLGAISLTYDPRARTLRADTPEAVRSTIDRAADIGTPRHADPGTPKGGRRTAGTPGNRPEAGPE